MWWPRKLTLKEKFAQMDMGNLLDFDDQKAEFRVKGSEGAYYKVVLQQEPKKKGQKQGPGIFSCECKAFTEGKTRPCKHLKLIFDKVGAKRNGRGWHEKILEKVPELMPSLKQPAAAPAEPAQPAEAVQAGPSEAGSKRPAEAQADAAASELPPADKKRAKLSPKA